MTRKIPLATCVRVSEVTNASDTHDDDELVRRAAAGDDDAFRQLVERWERPVFAFLARMLDSREDAEDLTSETFLRIHRAAPRYRPDGKFKSWLFRIAGNLARSELRRRAVVRWVGLESAPEPATDRTAGDAVETQELVRNALAELPARQRQAMLLRHYQEMSYKEIAGAMDTTVSAVETLLYRASQNLKSRLREPR